MSRAATKPAQMAFLRLGGGHGYLLSSDAAMKVAALLQSAFVCDETLDRTDVVWTYQVLEPAEVEFKLVRANQVRQPKPAEPDQEDSLFALPAPMRRLPR
jgi:hypothetical protein